MLARCNNPKNADYPRYGGRGVKVCDRWRDFAAFAQDMGARPRGATLDREKNDVGYEPGNCRWATAAQQAENRSTTRYVVLDGQTMPITKACQLLGKSPSAYLSHTRKGLTPQQAIDWLRTSTFT